MKKKTTLSEEDQALFRQAPKEYGGDAALLVLIEVDEWLPPELP